MDGKHRFRKLALRLVFFALLGWAVALVRAVLPRRGWDEWSEDESAWTPKPAPVAAVVKEPKQARRSFRSHRLVTSFGLVAVFFAAATFTAGAGDMLSKALDPARCAALMQTTGEDESVCAQIAQEEALQAAQADAEEAAAEAAPEAAAPEALPASETAAPEAAAEPSSESASVDAEAAPADQGQTAEAPDAASTEQAPDASAPAAAPEADEDLILAPTGPS